MDREDMCNFILKNFAPNLRVPGFYFYIQNLQFSLCRSLIFSGRTPERIKHRLFNIKFCVLRSLKEGRRMFPTSHFFPLMKSHLSSLFDLATDWPLIMKFIQVVILWGELGVLTVFNSSIFSTGGCAQCV